MAEVTEVDAINMTPVNRSDDAILVAAVLLLCRIIVCVLCFFVGCRVV